MNILAFIVFTLAMFIAAMGILGGLMYLAKSINDVWSRETTRIASEPEEK